MRKLLLKLLDCVSKKIAARAVKKGLSGPKETPANWGTGHW